MPRVLPHTDPAALMGTGCTTGIRESGRPMAAGCGYPGGRRPLAMSLLALPRFYRKRPMRQPGQKAVTGRVASHTLNRFQTAGPHALYVPFRFNDQTGNGA